MPMTVSAAIHRHRSAVLQADHVAIQAELRAIMVGVLPADTEAELTEALDAVLSIDLWRRLRLEQRLAPAAATAVLHRIVGGLLAG